jgi:ABC-type antimicrobial peptide transport system permease subunit
MANIGLAPREIRIVILTAGLVLAGLSSITALGIALGLIAVLATITTIQRIVVTINQARTSEQG